MKPFNIELAKAGYPVCTRDGRKARILCYDRNTRQSRCIVALVTESTGLEEIYTYTLKGQISRIEETNHDLMMASEKKTGWVNVYPKECVHNLGIAAVSARIYPTEEIAKSNSIPKCIATVPIEWEE